MRPKDLWGEEEDAAAEVSTARACCAYDRLRLGTLENGDEDVACRDGSKDMRRRSLSRRFEDRRIGIGTVAIGLNPRARWRSEWLWTVTTERVDARLASRVAAALTDSA